MGLEAALVVGNPVGEGARLEATEASGEASPWFAACSGTGILPTFFGGFKSAVPHPTDCGRMS